MSKGRLAEAMSAADRDDRYWRLDDLMAHRDPVPESENSASFWPRWLCCCQMTGPPSPSLAPEGSGRLLPPRTRLSTRWRSAR